MFEHLLKQMGSLAAAGPQFTQAQQSGQYDQVDPHQAAEYVDQFTRHASPEQQQQVFSEYVRSLSPQQRAALGQAMVAHAGVPVQNVQADDDHDLSRALGTSSQALQGGAQGGLGGLFGMFGQAMGGQQPSQASPQGFGPPAQGAQGGLDLGSLLQNPLAKAGLLGLAGMIGSKLLNQR